MPSTPLFKELLFFVVFDGYSQQQGQMRVRLRELQTVHVLTWLT